MAFTFTIGDGLGLAAGIVILLLGAFVIAARPSSWLHRSFFLFALADGLSTILFALRNGSPDLETKRVLYGAYWHYFLAFVALLAGFGVLFPRPLGGPRVARTLALGIAAVALALEVAYVARHDLFWTVSASGSMPRGPLGDAVFAAFPLLTAAILARLAHAFPRAPSGSHRTQIVLLLAGLAIGFAPYATTSFFLGLREPSLGLLSPRLGNRALFLTYALTVLAVCYAAVVIARDRHPAHAAHRRAALGSLAFVALLSLAALASPASFADALRRVGLVAYPLVLAYAIVRYGVFDFDAHVRRAAALTLGTGAAAGAFVLAENALAGALAGGLAEILPWNGAPTVLAALGAAAVGALVARIARHAARRVLPGPPPDEERARKLEIYRHALAGAVADGRVDESENRTLAALRESLGLSREEHARALADLKAPS